MYNPQHVRHVQICLGRKSYSEELMPWQSYFSPSMYRTSETLQMINEQGKKAVL
jgi:hypothetical protein